MFMKMPGINFKIGVGTIVGILGKMSKRYFFNHSELNLCERTPVWYVGGPLKVTTGKIGEKNSEKTSGSWVNR